MVDKNPIWSLKYKPKRLEDICGRDQIVSQLKDFISNKNFPHLLITGNEGVGKTSISKCFAKAFLGEFYDSNFKLLYADIPVSSEEKSQAGISATFSKSVIGSRAGRKRYIHPFLDIKVKPFVQIRVLGEIPFKILIVKNFEALGQFQQGFRRLMETYGTNCRMIIITTRVSSIIDPIVSRCQLMFISQIEFTNFKKLILNIADEEGITINEPAIEILYKYTEGQINKAINIVQLASMNTTSINSEILHDVIDQFRERGINELLNFIYKGDFVKCREHIRSIRRTSNYSAREIYKKILDEVLLAPLGKKVKIQFIIHIADADFRGIDGSDDDIQLSNLISKLCLLSNKL
jgi:replication factor C small subunit